MAQHFVLCLIMFNKIFFMDTQLLYQTVTYISSEKYPTFAHRLQFAMALRGYSTQKLARHIFLSPSTLRGYYHGRRMPDCAPLCLIARELQVSTDFLLVLCDYFTVLPPQK